MKPETKLKKALETENPVLKLMKLDGICLTTIPHSDVWKKARAAADKLRAAGVQYQSLKSYVNKGVK